MATEGPASKPASSPKLEVDKLQVALERDTWTYYPDTIVYRGQEIMHIDDTRLEVIQIDFLNAAPTRSLSRERYRPASQDLTAAEITEAKSVIGYTQWVRTYVSRLERPRLAAAA